MITYSYILKNIVSHIPDKNEIRRMQSRIRYWIFYVCTIILLLCLSLFVIKKFNKKKNEILPPYMQNVIGYINRKMDKILELETREEQNEAFRNLNLRFSLEPVRMTLTTAVFKCTKTNPILILKRVIKNPYSLLNEDQMSLLLSHENIIKTLKVFRNSRDKKTNQMFLPLRYTMDDYEILIWIISEYLDVKLSQKSIKGNESIIRNIIKDALKGLVYMHSKSIAHLDLKIGNIMGKNTPEGIVYKLIDFGYSLDVGKKGYKTIVGKNYGTYPYKPPEVVFNNKHGLKSDIWSLGAVAWFLSLQYTPFYFDGQNKNMQAYKRFLTSKKNDKENNNRFFFSKETSENLQDFVRVCMNLNFDERPTALELLKHPFITETDISDNQN